MVLQAIRCKAIFMEALSYIGNGPDFMVKAISEQAGYRSPLFFGYFLYERLVHLPVNLFVTFVFSARARAGGTIGGAIHERSQ
jgi:hypothetical protein